MKSEYTPKHFDSGANAAEALLLRHMDVTDVALMMNAEPVTGEPGDRLMSANEVAHTIGVGAKTLGDWRRQTVETGKLVGLPWCVTKIGGYNLVAYVRSDVRRFFDTYVKRIDPHLLDGEMARIWADAMDEEHYRREAAEQAEQAAKQSKAKATETFFTMSGSSPPASNGQGGAQ